MEPGKERDELVKLTANQMRRDLAQWSHGSCDEEKVAADLARFTDGKIHLDLKNFKFEKLVLVHDNVCVISSCFVHISMFKVNFISKNVSVNSSETSESIC